MPSPKRSRRRGGGGCVPPPTSTQNQLGLRRSFFSRRRSRRSINAWPLRPVAAVPGGALLGGGVQRLQRREWVRVGGALNLNESSCCCCLAHCPLPIDAHAEIGRLISDPYLYTAPSSSATRRRRTACPSSSRSSASGPPWAASASSSSWRAATSRACPFSGSSPAS